MYNIVLRIRTGFITVWLVNKWKLYNTCTDNFAVQRRMLGNHQSRQSDCRLDALDQWCSCWSDGCRLDALDQWCTCWDCEAQIAPVALMLKFGGQLINLFLLWPSKHGISQCFGKKHEQTTMLMLRRSWLYPQQKIGRGLSNVLGSHAGRQSWKTLNLIISVDLSS